MSDIGPHFPKRKIYIKPNDICIKCDMCQGKECTLYLEYSTMVQCKNVELVRVDE